MEAPRPKGDRLAVIYGSSVSEGVVPIEGERVEVRVGERTVVAVDGTGAVALPRHGMDGFTPAHLLDHGATIRALCELGCDRVLALASTGSLRLDWRPGTVVCPDDFFAPGVGPSFHQDAGGHSIPGFDPDWRRRVVGAWNETVEEPKLIDGGVYAQTRGPPLRDPRRGARAGRRSGTSSG